MYLIITSAEDTASMNIRDKLLNMADWQEVGTFDGSAILEHDVYHMILIQDIHLYWEDPDKAVEKATGRKYECFIFASRHRSQSGLRTLTVHALGNYGNADFGGKPGTLVPVHPKLMTKALLLLKEYASDLDFQISFETTHHGPYLNTPTFFIEIGSDENAWPEEEPAVRIAQVILELADSSLTDDDDIVIGVGGGHYAPRHTDLVERMKASIGHMIPNYAIEHLDSQMIAQVKEKSQGASMVYFHKKSLKAAKKRELEELFAEHEIRSVRSPDLKSRD
ncbi:MAG: D-aminoacyl-tRNA deacylase [Thermoplasmata archaeon]|nr:D-aminoacyl-tRNA deacylase [Thermoplasmata archaeon]